MEAVYHHRAPSHHPLKVSGFKKTDIQLGCWKIATILFSRIKVHSLGMVRWIYWKRNPWPRPKFFVAVLKIFFLSVHHNMACFLDSGISRNREFLFWGRGRGMCVCVCNIQPWARTYKTCGLFFLNHIYPSPVKINYFFLPDKSLS